MKYKFNLEWDELPKAFRKEKITEYINNSDMRYCEKCDGEGTHTIIDSPAEQAWSEERGTYIKDEESHDEDCEQCKGQGQVDPDPEDDLQQEEAEEAISAHFPIYF